MKVVEAGLPVFQTMEDREVFGTTVWNRAKHIRGHFLNSHCFCLSEFWTLGLWILRQAYLRVSVRQTFLSRGSACRPFLHLFPGYIKDKSTLASVNKQGSSALMNTKWFSCIRVWYLVNFSLTYICMFISILTSTLIMSSLICLEPYFSWNHRVNINLN